MMRVPEQQAGKLARGRVLAAHKRVEREQANAAKLEISSIVDQFIAGLSEFYAQRDARSAK